MNRESHRHHHHTAPDYNRAFAVGVALNVIFVVIEVTYGVIADSLALLTDAGHNLSDVLGLLLAWGASYLAKKNHRGDELTDTPAPPSWRPCSAAFYCWRLSR